MGQRTHPNISLYIHQERNYRTTLLYFLLLLFQFIITMENVVMGHTVSDGEQ